MPDLQNFKWIPVTDSFSSSIADQIFYENEKVIKFWIYNVIYCILMNSFNYPNYKFCFAK